MQRVEGGRGEGLHVTSQETILTLFSGGKKCQKNAIGGGGDKLYLYIDELIRYVTYATIFMHIYKCSVLRYK